MMSAQTTNSTSAQQQSCAHGWQSVQFCLNFTRRQKGGTMLPLLTKKVPVRCTSLSSQN